MNRRQSLSALPLAAWSIAGAFAAEQAPKTIGWLTFTGTNEGDLIWDTMAALGKFGWRRGANLRLERRVPTATREIDAFADELVGFRPDVLVTNGEGATSIVLSRTKALPLVFYNTFDPAAAGIVESLARPGGQATGFVGYPISLGPRWVQLLRQLVPGLGRLAVVLEPASRSSLRLADAIRSFAEPLGISVATWPATDFGTVEHAMRTWSGKGAAAVIAVPDPSTYVIRRDLTWVAHQTRTPVLFWYSEAVRANALMSYGPDRSDLPTKLAACIDRILRGATPSSIPVEEPVRYELAINRLIAGQFGLDIPPLLAAEASLIVE